MANTAVVGSPKSARPPSWQVNKHFLPQSLNSNTKRLSETPSNIISRNPKRFILSGKPRNMFVTGKPRYMFLSLGKPRNFFHRQPFKTPPRKRDKQSKGDSNIQEPRQPSKKRSRFDSVEKHRERSVHQELKASQALKVRIRLDTVFEKENYSNCSLQKKGTLSKGVTTTSKGQGKRRKLSLGKNSKSLKCYTCGVFVKDAHFKEHLFFGESECTRCNLKIIDCQTFVESRIDCLMGNSLCSHTLRFTKKPSDYISNRLAQELPFEWDTSRRLASYISSLQKLKMIDPWKRAINQCQNFLDGEPSHISEASEGHINASETATDFSFRQETVPTYEHESCNLPSPSLVNGDGDFVLSQSYNLEHLNEAVEYEVARDSPLVTREISPLSSESSGANNITGSLSYPKANIDTVSESSLRKKASKRTRLPNMSESLSSSYSHKSPKSLKTKSKPGKRSKARISSKANRDVEKTILETPSEETVPTYEHESSGGNNITGRVSYPKANIDTVSESSLRKKASKRTRLPNMSESLSSSNSHKSPKTLKTKSKHGKRSKARNNSKANRDVEKTFLETPSEETVPTYDHDSSGGNNITGRVSYPKANIDTVSESSLRKKASKRTRLPNMSESLSSSYSHKSPKSLKTKSKPGKRSKARNSSKTVIETPSDGYYLILRHAIEECPMCYTELCRSRFTVNVNTFLLTTICIGCNLTIYRIPDTPDGSAPKIVIFNRRIFHET